MPGIGMKKYLEPPANWQDFEDLCYLLWKFIWQDRNAKKNGRQGQAQWGVDVYGTPLGNLHFEGVQCKGKNSYAEQKLSMSEIETELSKAMSFKPPIKSLVFATTALSDSGLLDKVREIPPAKYNGIIATVKSWDEIDLDIRLYPALLAAVYSDSLTSMTWERASANSFKAEVSVQHIDQSIFDLMISEMARMHIGSSLRFKLKNIATEIGLNAVKFQNSKSCQLKIENNEFQIMCEGKFFDLTKHLGDPSSKKNGGMNEILSFLNAYRGEVDLVSEDVSGGSLYRFIFKSELSDIVPSGQPFEVNFDGMFFRGNERNIKIPNGAKNILLNLPEGAANMTNGIGLIVAILRLMDDDAVLKLCVDWDGFRMSFLYDRLANEIKDGRIVIERK